MADERVTKSGVRILRHMLPDRLRPLKTSLYGDKLQVDGKVYLSHPERDVRYGFASTVIKLVELDEYRRDRMRSGVLTDITA